MNKRRYNTILKFAFGLLLITGMWQGPPAVLASQDAAAQQDMASRYGIDCEVLEAHRDVIRQSQNLADILLKQGVSYAKISEAVAKCEDLFDVRKIRAGNSYCIIKTPESPEAACYFVYEQNPVDYVVFDLGEAVDVYRDRKPVKIRTRMAEGMIKSSLLEAFSQQGLAYDLAIGLSEVYAWTLDFYHFQKGDTFKIIFEEKYAEGKPVGYGRILASRITQKGEDYYAFFYKDKGQETGEYFDEAGRSLRKAFLKAPLKYVRISSGYSRKRLHPILQEYKPHLGIDYAAPAGTPIMSVGDGVVEKVTYNKSAGRYVQIRHNRRYMTQYLHISEYAEGIRTGTPVRQGQVIGYVGSTGLATGPHLDFRFWIDGEAVNFLKQDIPTVHPMASGYMKRFYARISDWKTDLDRDDIRTFSAERMVLPPVPYENSTDFYMFSETFLR